MKLITFKHKGKYKNFRSFSERVKEKVYLGCLNKYGRQGVNALQNNTPFDTGETSSSWYYEIEDEKDSVILRFNNRNVINGVNIAILIQYGHSTKNGAWVQGVDYINPSLQPIFDKIADEAWKELTR